MCFLKPEHAAECLYISYYATDCELQKKTKQTSKKFVLSWKHNSVEE